MSTPLSREEFEKNVEYKTTFWMIKSYLYQTYINGWFDGRKDLEEERTSKENEKANG
jgi:hypothetical protein